MNTEKNATQTTIKEVTTRDFSYYLNYPSNAPETVPASELSTAFLEGYISALRRFRIYDDALFLSGGLLRTHVLGDLIFNDKKISDAIRAQSRVIANTFGKLDRSQLRGICLSAAPVDDDGNTVDDPSHSTTG